MPSGSNTVLEIYHKMSVKLKKAHKLRFHVPSWLSHIHVYLFTYVLTWHNKARATLPSIRVDCQVLKIIAALNLSFVETVLNNIKII